MDDKKAKILDLVRNGETYGKIGKSFGISRQRVHQIAKKEGIIRDLSLSSRLKGLRIEVRGKGRRKVERNALIVQLNREQGLGYKSIAKIFDLHFTTVANIIQRDGKGLNSVLDNGR
jgi:DNA invertase Pin-like site-specific DNA recombinase